MLAALAAHAQNMPVAQIADPHGVARPENLRCVLFMFHPAVVRRNRTEVKREQRSSAAKASKPPQHQPKRTTSLVAPTQKPNVSAA